MVKFFLITISVCILNSSAFGQYINRSYHPVDPSIDGSFIINGKLPVTVIGNYSQTENSLILNGVTETKVHPSTVWDVVHKPSGNGTYNFKLELSGIVYPLADFEVTQDSVKIVYLYNGAKVATDQFWTIGDNLSHWQVGKYLALISPIRNNEIPRCSSLIITTTGNVSLEMVTVVTQNTTECITETTCIRTPIELLNDRFRFASDPLVNVSRFPFKSVRGLSYLTEIINSRHPSDRYDSYAISVQVELSLFQPERFSRIYNTSMLAYANNRYKLLDYTIAEVLNNYLQSVPLTDANVFFGQLLENFVLSSNMQCTKFKN